MKKPISILIMSVSLLIISGCSDKLEEKSYYLEEDGVKSTVTYYHIDGKVKKQEAENILNYDELGMTKEQVEETLAAELEKAEGIEGYSDTIDYQEDAAIETVEIDYKKLDVDKADEIVGFYTEGDISQGVDLEKSAEILSEQGYQEK